MYAVGETIGDRLARWYFGEEKESSDVAVQCEYIVLAEDQMDEESSYEYQLEENEGWIWSMVANNQQV
jgi:hypothetical protein